MWSNLRALRKLFAKSTDLRRRHWSRNWKFLGEKPDVTLGLTFANVIDWIDLPKPMRRPKHIRALLAEAEVLGMIRVENGRYFANDLLFYRGPEKEHLIDPRPLVRRADNECASCGGHLSNRLGCYLCEGCGLSIDKPRAIFRCSQCQQVKDGFVDRRGSVTSLDNCDRRLGYHCEGTETNDPPTKSLGTTGTRWEEGGALQCPYCRATQADRFPAADPAGLVRCDEPPCQLPFYLPVTR